ncbi:MAG: sensor histidine kinase [Flavobacteriales bacterium]|nr:sensor histidine kinase [Flavobacteriales bacterium]
MSQHPQRAMWPYVMVAIVVSIALAVVVWGILAMPQRHAALAQVGGERVIGNMRSLVLSELRFLERELQREAAFVGGIDSLDILELEPRWSSLLDSEPAIRRIRLADEQGGDLSLALGENGMHWSRVLVQNGDHILWHLPTGLSSGHDSLWTRATGGMNDVRTSSWYSRTLEEQREVPVWVLAAPSETDSTGVLFLATVVPSMSGRRGFRLICFEVVSADLLRSLPRSDVQNSYTGLAMTADEVQLLPVRSDEDRDAEALSEGLRRWRSLGYTNTPEFFRVNDRPMMIYIRRTTLNGTHLYLGVLMDITLLKHWTAGEQGLLWSGLVLLIVLIVLLVLIFRNDRASIRQIKKQSQRQRAQERRLAKALGERDVLDREVHHRVKNNLQVVSSLLNIQAQRIEDGPTKQEFLRSKQRIDIMAVVHQRLYGLSDLRRVELSTFFGGLAKNVADMHGPRSRTVSHEIQTHDLDCDPDTAIELGIILCELMANCYEHAFPLVTGGHIDVEVQHLGTDLYRLTVKDNGTGLAKDALERSGRLGFDVVSSLADKLDGTFKHHSNGGTTFDVLFRMQPGPG